MQRSVSRNVHVVWLVLLVQYDADEGLVERRGVMYKIIIIINTKHKTILPALWNGIVKK